MAGGGDEREREREKQDTEKKAKIVNQTTGEFGSREKLTT